MEHPEIPHGRYCYKILEVIGQEGRIKTELCPHWRKTENGAYCDIIKEEHHSYCGFHLVWDQVKECGINTENESVLKSIPREGSVLKTIVCECGKEMEVWHWSKNGNSH